MAITTVTQFKSALGYKPAVGDSLYTIDYPLVSGRVDNAVNRFTWLQAFGTLPTDLFTGATFTGTGALIIANKAKFDTELVAAGAVEIV